MEMGSSTYSKNYKSNTKYNHPEGRTDSSSPPSSFILPPTLTWYYYWAPLAHPELRTQ